MTRELCCTGQLGTRTKTTGVKLAPDCGDESAFLEGAAHGTLRPPVDHDPEGRKCGAQRDHRGREERKPTARACAQ